MLKAFPLNSRGSLGLKREIQCHPHKSPWRLFFVDGLAFPEEATGEHCLDDDHQDR